MHAQDDQGRRNDRAAQDAATGCDGMSPAETFVVGFDGSEVLGTCSQCGDYHWVREDRICVCCDARANGER